MGEKRETANGERLLASAIETVRREGERKRRREEEKERGRANGESEKRKKQTMKQRRRRGRLRKRDVGLCVIGLCIFSESQGRERKHEEELL